MVKLLSTIILGEDFLGLFIEGEIKIDFVELMNASEKCSYY